MGVFVSDFDRLAVVDGVEEGVPEFDDVPVEVGLAVGVTLCVPLAARVDVGGGVALLEIDAVMDEDDSTAALPVPVDGRVLLLETVGVDDTEEDALPELVELGVAV